MGQRTWIILAVFGCGTAPSPAPRVVDESGSVKSPPVADAGPSDPVIAAVPLAGPAPDVETYCRQRWPGVEYDGAACRMLVIPVADAPPAPFLGYAQFAPNLRQGDPTHLALQTASGWFVAEHVSLERGLFEGPYARGGRVIYHVYPDRDSDETRPGIVLCGAGDRSVPSCTPFLELDPHACRFDFDGDTLTIAPAPGQACTGNHVGRRRIQFP